MATTYKTMKTFTRPDGDDRVQYEIVDDNGRKMIAPNWYEHEDDAFTVGQHIEKDGVLYRFTSAHTAEAAWDSSEVTAVSVTGEIESVKSDVNGKASKVSGGTENNFAALDANGDLKDSGSKASDFLTEHQDISGKANKVSGATDNHFAALDGNGDLKDSGKSASDFVASSDFTADKMPLSSSDTTKVSEALTAQMSAIQQKAPLIFDTVSNVAIASVSDAIAHPVTALKIGIEPKQSGSGDPYPAGGGKNKLNPELIVLGSYGAIADEIENGNNAYRRLAISLPAGTYTWSTDLPNCRLIRIFVDDVLITSAQTTQSSTFTLETQATVKICFRNTSTTAITASFNTQIELGSSATPFAPYSNVRTITGWDAVKVVQSSGNILNAVSANSLNYGGNYTNFTINDETGAVTITGGASMGVIVPVMPGKTYTFSYVKSSTEGINTRIREYSALPTSWTDNFIEQSVNESNGTSGRISKSFTVGANTTYIICSVYHGSSSTNLVVSEWMCEPGATASTYRTYNGYTTHTASLPSTVYGGEVDWVNGKVKVTHAIVDMGSLYWTKTNATPPSFGTDSITDRARGICFICSCYKTASSTGQSAVQNGEIGGNLNSVTMYVRDSDYSDASAFKTSVTGQKICYELATPIEITLSDLDEISTVTGVNNVWADCGDIVELTYACDTKGYIDKKFTELQALILENT